MIGREIIAALSDVLFILMYLHTEHSTSPAIIVIMAATVVSVAAITAIVPLEFSVKTLFGLNFIA